MVFIFASLSIKQKKNDRDRDRYLHRDDYCSSTDYIFKSLVRRSNRTIQFQKINKHSNRYNDFLFLKVSSPICSIWWRAFDVGFSSLLSASLYFTHSFLLVLPAHQPFFSALYITFRIILIHFRWESNLLNFLTKKKNHVHISASNLKDLTLILLFYKCKKKNRYDVSAAAESTIQARCVHFI
jgi:hypothetical protein